MISVCIATFNGERFIKTQIESILPQLSLSDEIIISDDSSTDKTVEILKSFNDNRIKIYQNGIFKNPIFNFENAIKKSSGEIIFLSDQDDLWLPKKVNDMMKVLEKYDLVVSNCFIGDQDLNVIKDSYFEWRNSRSGFIKNLFRNSYLGCCMAFKRDLIPKILPFPKHIPMHDIWIGMIAEVYYKPFFLESKLMIYRRHSNNSTPLSDNFKSIANTTTKIKYRWNSVFQLLKRIISLKIASYKISIKS